MPIQLSGSGSITGVSTLTSLASLDVTGSVSVGGTLIYDDVTNIDSLGIVTARSDVHIGAGLSVTGISTFNAYLDINGDINIDGSQITYTSSSNQLKFADDAQLRFGAGNDLRIYHNGTHSYIDNATNGALIIRNTSNDVDVVIESDDGSGNLASYFRADGSTGDAILYHYGNVKLATKSTGIQVTGTVAATSFSGPISGSIEVTQEYPSIRPTLDLNFAATKTLDRRITFTRDSIGTYTDDMGIIKYASNNVPRFDHDPATGESLGLLIEESRTNLFTYSENFDSWGTAYRTTISPNVAISPSGQLNASKFNVTTDTGYHARSFSITGGTYTVSIFAKAGEYNGIQITGSNTNQDHACFNLVNGTAYHSGTNVTNIKIENYGNGWYRCSARLPLTNGNLFVAITDGTTTSWLPSFAGSSATDGIYIWGAQVEAGSFTTSYIPTSGSTVTRAADLAKITGTNFTDFYNQEEGTTFVEYKGGRLTAFPDGYGRLVTTESWAMEHGSTGTSRYFGVAGGSYNNFNGLIDTDTNFAKYAASVDNSTYVAAASDGILETSITGTVTYSTTATKMHIGSSTGGAYQLNGTIKTIKYYNKRLPNGQLQGLTQQ